MHVEPPWINKLLFPPAIKDQRKEPPMTDRLAALVRRVTELRQAGLEACHCAEEFYSTGEDRKQTAVMTL
jgi:hypothetical protein